MFSKEGLAQAQKQDPKEKARNEVREWINTTVDNLQAEVSPSIPFKNMQGYNLGTVSSD